MIEARAQLAIRSLEEVLAGEPMVEVGMAAVCQIGGLKSLGRRVVNRHFLPLSYDSQLFLTLPR